MVGFQLQVAEIWAQELVGCLRKQHDKLAGKDQLDGDAVCFPHFCWQP